MRNFNPAPRADVPKDTRLISQHFRLRNVPLRNENPYAFSTYGSQRRPAVHVFYRTTALDYGWQAPTLYSIPHDFYPVNQHFSNKLYKAGMYRNYSLNATMRPQPFFSHIY